MKKITFIMTIIISLNLNAGTLTSKIITGKVMEGIGLVCEGYDIFDTIDLVTQKVISYKNIRFGYRRIKTEKFRAAIDRKTKKRVWIHYEVLEDVPYIILYNEKEDRNYWVNLTTNRAYHEGSNIQMPFSTIGWKKISQKQANHFFTAEIMNSLHSAYSL